MPWGLFILLAAGLALAWVVAVVYTMHLLTHPPRRSYAWAVARNVPGDPSELVHGDPPVRGLVFTEWVLRSRGLDLPVWEITGAKPDGPTIVLTHGWADSRVVMLSRVGFFASIASRVILWDLPGHADAPGTCSLGTREVDDLLELIDEASSTSLILYGFSLGAGISIAAATRATHPIAAIIAEAPYRVPPTPARNVLRIRALPYLTTLPAAMALLGIRYGQGLSWAMPAITHTRDGAPLFDRAALAARLANTPLLVLHGSSDPVCPPEDGREIAAAAPHGTFKAIENGGHNNLWTDPALIPQTHATISEFLADIARTGDTTITPQ